MLCPRLLARRTFLPKIRTPEGAAGRTEADVEVCQVREIGTGKRRGKTRADANDR